MKSSDANGAAVNSMIRMKCDELQYERLGEANWAYPASTLVIRKQFVDEAIAELKDIAENACLECDDNQTAIDELEDENRKLKRALWLARAKKAEIWERYWQIKISLLSFTCMYESKALFALEGYEEFPDTRFLHHTYRLAGKWELVWKKVKHLCIKKAEEYK